MDLVKVSEAGLANSELRRRIRRQELRGKRRFCRGAIFGDSRRTLRM